MKTGELTGAPLDYWVARAEGHTVVPHIVEIQDRLGNWKAYRPSTNWAQGGPIIERENIQIGPPTQSVHRNGGPNAGWGPSGVWSACTWHKGVNGRRSIAHDESSPLTAAMRAFVASKFGDEVSDEVQS